MEKRETAVVVATFFSSIPLKPQTLNLLYCPHNTIRLAGLAQKAADAEAGRSEVKRTTPTLPSAEVL